MEDKDFEEKQIDVSELRRFLDDTRSVTRPATLDVDPKKQYHENIGSPSQPLHLSLSHSTHNTNQSPDTLVVPLSVLTTRG